MDAEVVGGLGIWSVLAREQRSSVDGLTLGEHVWVLALGLGWSKPLESSALFGGRDLDGELDVGSLRDTLLKLDSQGGSVRLHALSQRPLRVVLQLAIGSDGDDVEVAGIEDNLLRLFISLRLKLKSDSSIKLLVVEVDEKIRNSVLRPPLIVVGESVWITREPVDASGGNHCSERDARKWRPSATDGDACGE